MLDWYFDINRRMRVMNKQAVQAFKLSYKGEDEKAEHNSLREGCTELAHLLEKRIDGKTVTQWLESLRRHVQYGETQDYADIAQRDLPSIQENVEQFVRQNLGAAPARDDDYVNETRISELEAKANPKFDTARLVRLCQELNAAHRAGALMATIMLVRAVLDHVPPVFGVQNFDQVVNNHQWGRSDKKSITQLQASSRNVADAYLHTQMRNRETLPTFQQVDFRSHVDVLLAEIGRLL
ncbi:MAG: hypothetical protein H7Y39_07185 [Nitrospiraceae bacterium]|nr:hypothetical protein [Nitrospiraceae bacterium]